MTESERQHLRTDTGTERKPFWVKCGNCGHVWPAAYLPMVAETFAKTARAYCPNCGNGPKRLFIAKQKDGQLNEPLAPHQNGATA